MTDETIVTSQSENDAPEAEQNQESKTEQIVKMRLKQTNAKHEAERKEYLNKIAALEEQINKLSPKASGTPSEAEENAAPLSNKTPTAPSGNIDRNLLMELIEKQKEMDALSSKINDATQKDTEFAKLAKEGNPVPQDVIANLGHLDNAVAVLKHFLKDKRAHKMMMTYREKNDLTGFLNYAHDLSEKLEQTSPRPSPSGYQASPDMSDTGDSAQDFDDEAYINEKY